PRGTGRSGRPGQQRAGPRGADQAVPRGARRLDTRVGGADTEAQPAPQGDPRTVPGGNRSAVRGMRDSIFALLTEASSGVQSALAARREKHLAGDFAGTTENLTRNVGASCGLLPEPPSSLTGCGQRREVVVEDLARSGGKPRSARLRGNPVNQPYSGDQRTDPVRLVAQIHAGGKFTVFDGFPQPSAQRNTPLLPTTGQSTQAGRGRTGFHPEGQPHPPYRHAVVPGRQQRHRVFAGRGESAQPSRS